MSLDAVVFRNLQNLAREFRRDLFDVDQVTGEAVLKPGACLRVPFDATIAVRVRLGNLDQVRSLRRKIAKVLGASESLILGRVLYSASHSGDTLGNEQFPRLAQEIELLRGQADIEVRVFAEALESLLFAARVEQNPIVFA